MIVPQTGFCEENALDFADSIHVKGVTAYTQIRRCVMRFCQIDKISTRTCIFDDAEILKIGQDSDFKITAIRRNYMKYIGAKLLFLPSRVIKHDIIRNT